MANLGDPMTSTIPVVGSSGTAYASDINTFLEEVQDRLEAPVPMTSLQASTLDMANNPIEDAEYVGLYPAVDEPSEVGTIQNFNGDFWWVSPSGACQLTDGPDLNAASIGGITGDYGGVDPAQLRFDGGDETYYFYDDFGAGDWANIRALTLEIAGGETSTDRVSIFWDGTSDYDIQLPDTPPVTQSMVQMAPTGELLVTNTLTTNESLTVSGTGTVKHGDHSFVESIWNCAATATIGGGLSTSVASETRIGTVAAASTIYFMLPGIKVGDRLKSVAIDGGATGTDPTIILQKTNAAQVTAAVTTSSSGGTLPIAPILLTVTSPVVLAAGETYQLKFTGASLPYTLFTFTLTYDRT